MEHYAGIDVSLEFSSVCVVDAQGKIVREVKVATRHGSFFTETANSAAGPLPLRLESGPEAGHDRQKAC
jgi:transposase